MSVTNLGTRRELFVDRAMLDNLDQTFLKLHEPIPMEKVLFADRPGEGGSNAASAVIHVDGRYLMYYRAMDITDPEDMGKFCLAISTDGIHFEKPALQESGTNYVICDDGALGRLNTFGVFLDTKPGVPKDERIKGFVTIASEGEHNPNNDPGGRKHLVMLCSADGITFRRMPIQADLETDLNNAFDGGCTMSWSEAEGCYVFYFRMSNLMRPHKGHIYSRRTMARSTSKDLIHWTTPVEMGYSDTPEQFYVNNTYPYYRAPHIYIGIAARFMETKRALTPEQAKQAGVLPTAYFVKYPDRRPKDWVKAGHAIYDSYNDCSDAVLLTTRAGSTVYDRTFMEVYVRPGPDYGNWATRTNYPIGELQQLDDKTLSFYVSRHYCQNSWHLQRLALRIDGFASLSAGWRGGTAVTKPFIFEGNELELNYRTSAAGCIHVELLDENGNLIPGFEGIACRDIVGDEIKRVVTWESDQLGYSLAQHAGKPVRLRFIMNDADIFSFKFNKV